MDNTEKMTKVCQDGIQFGMFMMNTAGENGIPLGAVAMAITFLEAEFTRHEPEGWPTAKAMARQVFDEAKKAGLIPEPISVSTHEAYSDED